MRRNGFTTFMKTERGFTLIELMVVIVIIAILAMVASVIYLQSLKSARLAKRIGDLKGVEMALELYRSKNDVYPLSASWRSECAIGGSLNADDVIPGLVPEYIQFFPSDLQMDKALDKSCYMYISTGDGSGYKLIDYRIDGFLADDYLRQRGLVDPSRDGGTNSCKVDGANPEAWGFYTYNACSL